MVDIISANEASKIANQYDNTDEIVDEFLKMADMTIREYATNGRHSVDLSCLDSNKGIIYSRIKEALTNKGYGVELDYPFIKIKW